MPLRSRRGVSVTYHIACKPPFLNNRVNSCPEPRYCRVNGCNTRHTLYCRVNGKCISCGLLTPINVPCCNGSMCACVVLTAQSYAALKMYANNFVKKCICINIY